MRHWFVLLISLFMLTVPPAWATVEYTASGARTAALGDASVTFSDAFATFSNQAGLGFLDDYAFGLYAERRFLLEDLNLVMTTAAIPTNSGTFGLGISYFGGELYNEKKVGLAYGRRFGEKLAIGVQFDYLGISAGEYGSKHAATFEAGLQYRPMDELILGAHVFNPVRIGLEEFYGETIPTIMKLGGAYAPEERVWIVAEVEKDIEHGLQFKAGVEYRVIEKLVLRAGVMTQPVTATFGLGVRLKQLNIDMATGYHPALGATPQLSISYLLPRKKKQDE